MSGGDASGIIEVVGEREDVLQLNVSDMTLRDSSSAAIFLSYGNLDIKNSAVVSNAARAWSSRKGQ